MFITIEGLDRSGKTTQLLRLRDKLLPFANVHMTREPADSTDSLRRLRTEILHQDWDSVSSLLLFLASRRTHFMREILPLLKRGIWVLCDRFVDSTYAYQGALGGVSDRVIDHLHSLILGDYAYLPRKTILLDVPLHILEERCAAQDNRYEHLSREEREKVRRIYLERAMRYPGRFVVVNAEKDIESVANTIWTALAPDMHG